MICKDGNIPLRQYMFESSLNDIFQTFIIYNGYLLSTMSKYLKLIVLMLQTFHTPRIMPIISFWKWFSLSNNWWLLEICLYLCYRWHKDELMKNISTGNRTCISSFDCNRHDGDESSIPITTYGHMDAIPLPN